MRGFNPSFREPLVWNDPKSVRKLKEFRVALIRWVSSNYGCEQEAIRYMSFVLVPAIESEGDTQEHESSRPY